MTTILIVAFGMLNRRGYAWALALGGVTPIGAAAVSGAVAVPTFYTVAFGAATGLLFMALRGPMRTGQPSVRVPGESSLVLLLLTSLLVTLGAPLLFDGTPVLPPSGPSSLAAGLVTKSNLAQMVYLALAVSVVSFLARARWAGVEIIGLTLGGVVLLSAWAHLNTLTGLPYPSNFFDNSPTFIYQDMFPGGAPRVRGIMSEPAGLATVSLTYLAYGASRFRRTRGLRRVALILLMVVAATLGVISTSATFYIASLLLMSISLVVTLGPFLFAQNHLGRGVLILACGTLGMLAFYLPTLTAAFNEIVDAKIGSSSFDDRSGADDFAYRVALDTFGVGAGLGANRASSFLASMLSTIGIAGTVFFIHAVAVLLRRTWPDRTVRPAAWALIAVLACKVISGPDLSDTSGIPWLALGVLAASAVRARQRTITPLGTGESMERDPSRATKDDAQNQTPRPAERAKSLRGRLSTEGTT